MKEFIQFTVIENGTAFQIETFPGEFRNLMLLLRDRIYLEDFGECNGMGRCATCVVKTHGITGDSRFKERNEPATLLRIDHVEDEIRLSCQLLISADLNGSTIEIIYE